MEELLKLHCSPGSTASLDCIPLISSFISNLNDDICALPSGPKTKKFSVKSHELLDCNFVHVADHRLSCQSGSCDATYGTSRRLVRYLETTKDLCPHLNAMKNNKDSWLLQEMLEMEDDEVEEEQICFENEDGDEEVDTKENKDCYFDETSGLWNFKSLSTHKPKPDGDDILQKAIHQRQRVSDGAPDVSRNEMGYLTSPLWCRLYPALEKQECLCGAGYYSADFPDGILSDVKASPCIYLVNGPAIYTVQDRECLAKNKDCRLDYYETAEDCIHFLSKQTGAGDEIGYEFMDHAMHTHISAFCTLKNAQYKRMCDKSAKFMSAHTFISWWFSWSSNFKIDFRQPCYICKHEPKYLACDGKKLGINFRHANITPIENPTSENNIDPCHRRNQRAFLSTRDEYVTTDIVKCRNHLLYFSRKHLGLFKRDEEMDDNEEYDLNLLLLETVDIDCKDILRRFICNDYPQNIQKKMAVLLKSLSTGHFLSGIIPFRYIDLLERVLIDVSSGFFHSVVDISVFSSEIQELILSSFKHENALRDIIIFLNYLLKRVKSIKDLNKQPDPPVAQPGTYNPERYVRAYYFTNSGEQVRNIPIYSMNEKAHSNNYDDPLAGQEGKCNKLYPQVSRKGTTYLFLWFDPKHYGHCYGYHMIPGSEGRKDPFSSAYAFMEEAPEEIFYDFACQLEEYCLNREPGFFQNTRFWHDLFHGFSHKCPFNFKSQRLVALKNLNTEICEQFNAFIQRIKYSARAMSMSKFNFYLQFMIYLWCQKKKDNFQKRCNVAASYLL